MTHKRLTLLLVLSLLSITTSFALTPPYLQVQKLGDSARRVSRGTVPAIVKMVNDGWTLLNQAIATGNNARALLAASIFDKAIKLSRVEHSLRREQRKTIRRLQKVRQHVSAGSNRGAVSSLRQAETLMASIRQSGAFFQLKHGFIRRTLRLINQKIKQVEKKSPQKSAKLQAKIKRFENLFTKAQLKVQKAGNGLWAKLRRADNKYRRALVAIRSERYDVAHRLLKDALRTLERILDNRGNPVDKGEEESVLSVTVGGPRETPPQEPIAPSAGSLSLSCRKAINDAEGLRASVVPSVGNNSVAKALVRRADRLVAEARTLSRRSKFREAIKKVSLADRLYKRAFQIASSGQ